MIPPLNQTPTETLMRAMEAFGQDEPLECIVVWTTQGGDSRRMASTSKFSPVIGMLRTAEFWIKEDMRKADDDSTR